MSAARTGATARMVSHKMTDFKSLASPDEIRACFGRTDCDYRLLIPHQSALLPVLRFDRRLEFVALGRHDSQDPLRLRLAPPMASSQPARAASLRRSGGSFAVIARSCSRSAGGVAFANNGNADFPTESQAVPVGQLAASARQHGPAEP